MDHQAVQVVVAFLMLVEGSWCKPADTSVVPRETGANMAPGEPSSGATPGTGDDYRPYGRPGSGEPTRPPPLWDDAQETAPIVFHGTYALVGEGALVEVRSDGHVARRNVGPPPIRVRHGSMPYEVLEQIHKGLRAAACCDIRSDQQGLERYDVRFSWPDVSCQKVVVGDVWRTSAKGRKCVDLVQDLFHRYEPTD